MPVLIINITYTGVPKLSKRNIQKVKAKAMESVGWAWDNKFKKIHFTSEGARKYHYAKRKTKEITTGVIKKSQYGSPKAPDGRPLVWTGESMRNANTRRVAATAYRVRVIFPTVNTFNRPTKNPNINMGEEFRRTTRAEEKTLDNIARARVLKVMRGMKHPVRVSISN